MSFAPLRFTPENSSPPGRAPRRRILLAITLAGAGSVIGSQSPLHLDPGSFSSLLPPDPDGIAPSPAIDITDENCTFIERSGPRPAPRHFPRSAPASAGAKPQRPLDPLDLASLDPLSGTAPAVASSEPPPPRIATPEPLPASPITSLKREAEYAAYLATLPLRYITIPAILRSHVKVRGGVANELPPPSLWPSMKPTLLLADKIREQLGVPLDLIVSSYRSPAYNAKCPGAAPKSYHTRNIALDLRFACDSQRTADAAKKLCSNGFFKGGIGIYPGFVHVDTRGSNATW